MSADPQGRRWEGADPFAGDLAIESHGLTKRFGHQVAVDNVDLAVPRGSVFGFLGPNGSGKTTTIRMLLGLAAATSGEMRVLGKGMPGDFHDVLPRVGALVEGPAFYPFLSGASNLHRLDTADRHAHGATRDSRVAEALERVGLGHAAGKKVRAYSLGMKQRLGIANALLRPRELLVLDEPTNGLDPQGTREVRSLIRSLSGEGTTVFVSSHLLAEIEQICTHAAVMRTGRLVAQGTIGELRRAGESRVLLRTPDVDRARSVLDDLGLRVEKVGGSSAGREGPESEERIAATFGDRQVTAEGIVAALVAGGVRVRGFSCDQGSLEDRFVALTGEGFEIAE